MATINDANVAANIVQVGSVSTLTTQYPAHVNAFPYPHGSLNHYKSAVRFTLAAAQTATSRVWEVRNTHGSNMLVVTRFLIRTVQIAAGTAQSNGLEIFRDTTFTAVDTTNTVTPIVVPARSDGAAAPGAAAIRHVTVAGAAAGMTGGTRTPDTNTLRAVPIVVVAAAAAAVQSFDLLSEVEAGGHPQLLLPNQGIEIQNRVLNVTSYGVDVYVDFDWVEVAAF